MAARTPATARTVPGRGRLDGVDVSDASERWLPALGYEGWYEVSDLGRVRSVDRVIPVGREGRTRRYVGRILKPYAEADGRRRVNLHRAGSASRAVSVMVLETFEGPRPEGFECCHYDGDASNDRLENLRWDTTSANKHDSVRHGTHDRAKRTSCPRDHLLVQPNLMPSALRAGRRNCSACDLARGRQRRARRQGRPFDFVAEADAIYADIMGGRAAA